MDTTITANPPAAGEAAQTNYAEEIAEFLLFNQLLPTLRDIALADYKTWPDHPSAVGEGYAVFFEGTLSGWTGSLFFTAQNGNLSWRPGCVAVNLSGPVEFHLSVGGNYQDGAARWQRINGTSTARAVA